MSISQYNPIVFENVIFFFIVLVNQSMCNQISNYMLDINCLKFVIVISAVYPCTSSVWISGYFLLIKS